MEIIKFEKFNIHEHCTVSDFPCEHYVYFNNINVKLLMNSFEVCKLLKNNNLDIPEHFILYKTEYRFIK